MKNIIKRQFEYKTIDYNDLLIILALMMDQLNDNIHNVVKDVLRHRIAISYKARAEGITVDQVIDKIMEQVAVVA